MRKRMYVKHCTVLLGTMLLLAACTPTPAPATPGEPSSSSAAPSAPAPTTASPAETTPPVVPADPTCETLISKADVAAFADKGWTVRESPFMIEELEFAQGLTCMWGDFEGPGSDNVMIFGWAPITLDAAESARKLLLGYGWVEESGDGVLYVTNPNPLSTDANGYGDTYAFYDDYVLYGVTKQALNSIVVPEQ